MKKVFAIVIAVILLAAMTPMAFAASATVYFSASVNGELVVAAQPITVSELTVDAVLKAAHEQFYAGGESGYVASDDPMWGYFITEAWGIASTPYVVLNGAPLGADSAIPANANECPVSDGDNIILCTPSDGSVVPVALSKAVSGDSVTITAVSWLFSTTSYTYTSEPFANADVIDAVSGESLGTTDSNGTITVSLPDSGIIGVGNMASIYVGTPSAAEEPADEEPVVEEPVDEEPVVEEPVDEEPVVEEPVVEEPVEEIPSDQYDNLPQTGGTSASTIIGFIGLGLIAVGASLVTIRKKITSK